MSKEEKMYHWSNNTSTEFEKHLSERVHFDPMKQISNMQTGKRIFETGSQRDDDSNKPLTTNLTAYARLRYGFHMRKNASKYGKGNWEKGQPNDALLESMDRHVCQYMSGDRSEDHLSAIMFGVVMLMQNEEREGIKVDEYYGNKESK